MARSKPLVCKKCGRSYTGWRCPRCYKRRRSSGGGGSRGPGRGWSASSVLWRSFDYGMPVSPEACPQPVNQHGEGAE
jgi:hypothetical protein